MITQQNITTAIAVLGALFGAFLFFRRPQEKSETKEAILSLEIKNLMREMTDKFLTLEKGMDLIKNNDLHELKGMFNSHVQNQNAYEREMSDKFARLDVKLEMLIKK